MLLLLLLLLAPTASPEYEELYARQQKKERKLATLEEKKDAMERVARSKVGLWSEYGLAAVRDKFWYMVNEGTGFAKRSTWWDAFFLVLSGRGDEGIAGFLLRLLMNFIFNFTIGMAGAFSTCCRTRFTPWQRFLSRAVGIDSHSSVHLRPSRA